MRRKLQSVCRGLFVSLMLLGSGHGWAAAKMNVVVSVKPIHSIVAGLMQDIDEPVLLLDDNQSVFNARLSPAMQQQLQSASLFIWVGPELEKSLQPVVSQLPPSVKVVELLDSPDLKILFSRKNPDRRDPFFWMDDRNVMIMLDALTELLISTDPQRSHVYTRNRLKLLAPLEHIDKQYEYGYRGLKAGVSVQYYDTLQYFEQAYALKTLKPVTGLPGDPEDAASLLRVRSRIKSHQANCLLLDKSLPPDNLDVLIAGEDVHIGKLDVMGTGFKAGPDLYLQLMKYNTDVIKHCLNAAGQTAVRANQADAADDEVLFDGIGGRFILTDHLGRTVTERDMKGHYSLVYFGYTYCPDVCPTALMVLTQAFKILGERGNAIQPYFISVDPQRDTVKVLHDYVGYFDPRLVGLTGSPDMIRRVADEFKVKFEKTPAEQGSPELYGMDHTSSLYLMAPDGSFITKFANGIRPETLAKELTAIIH